MGGIERHREGEREACRLRQCRKYVKSRKEEFSHFYAILCATALAFNVAKVAVAIAVALLCVVVVKSLEKLMQICAYNFTQALECRIKSCEAKEQVT